MKKTLIIAEAGVNHNGDILLAKKLIDVAADAGADYVKFQTYKTENLVSSEAKMADYQIQNTGKTESQFDMLKRLELSYNDFTELKSHCELKKIKFLSTAFDLESIDFLQELGIDLYKIPSGEITNYHYLKKVASLKKKIILSTGMSNAQEVNEAIALLIDGGCVRENISILHCTTDYPTSYSDVNLKAMLRLKNDFNIEVGYSDHTLGIEVPIAAVAMGAAIIEKHFTIDKTLNGPDHKASLEPNELKQMISSIRNIELAFGNDLKKPTLNEEKNKLIARKSIHISRFINAGEVFTEDCFVSKRPGNGISPMQIPNIIGKRAKNNLEKDLLLNWENVE